MAAGQQLAATTTIACAAVNPTLPSMPHRLYTGAYRMPYANSAKRHTAAPGRTDREP